MDLPSFCPAHTFLVRRSFEDSYALLHLEVSRALERNRTWGQQNPARVRSWPETLVGVGSNEDMGRGSGQWSGNLFGGGLVLHVPTRYYKPRVLNMLSVKLREQGYLVSLMVNGVCVDEAKLDDDVASITICLPDDVEAKEAEEIDREDFFWSPTQQDIAAMFCPHSKREVKQIADEARSVIGCTGISSIGCGSGVFEWLLEEFFPNEVAVVDCSFDVIISQVRDSQRFLKMISGRWAPLPQIPRGHAMLFCFPVSQIPFDRYLEQYEGPGIIIIGDSSCHPNIMSESDLNRIGASAWI